MQELIAQFSGYVWGVWRYRWQALLLAWMVSIGGWFWVYQMPEQYVASARIHVDTNTVLRPLLRGLAIQPNIEQRIQLMSRTLLSRPNLEKLMRMTDMDLQIKDDAQRDRFIDSLKKDIRLSGERGNSSLYSLSFKHSDRELSKRIVQSLITVFIESTLSGGRSDSVEAQKFLDQQIADYEERLIESETRLAQFKQKYVGVLPGQGGGYYDRLSTAINELSTASLQLKEMKQRRRELKRQIAGEDPVFLSSASGNYQRSPIDSRINKLEMRLDDLLTRYTEKYPEVVQIRNLVADLEVEKKLEIEKAMAGQLAEYVGLQENPVYQQMRTMSAETEARVAEITVRVREYRLRVKKLEDMVDNIPVIEAKLKQLNRDYQVVQQKHTQLLSRRETALISQDVEQKSNDLVFRVIDPPFVPQQPNEPNKLLLNSVVLVAGLGLGGGIALLWSLLYPLVVDRVSLNHVTGLPVLGTVTLISTPEEKKQSVKNRILFALLFLSLLLAFVGCNFLQQWLLT